MNIKKADKYILLGITLFLTVSILGVYLFKTHFSRPGAIAIITQNGTLLHKIDLNNVDIPYEFVVLADEHHYNTIYVEKNQIRVMDANCPDKLCVKSGILSHTGDIAVCLPHGLFIEILEGEAGEIDSLSY